jgi:hypothetical protein
MQPPIFKSDADRQVVIGITIANRASLPGLRFHARQRSHPQTHKAHGPRPDIPLPHKVWRLVFSEPELTEITSRT